MRNFSCKTQNYLGPSDQEGLLEILDVEVVMRLVIILEGLLPPGVVQKSVAGTLAEVNVVDTVALVVVSEQKTII